MTPRPRLLLFVAMSLPILVAGTIMPPLRAIALPFNLLLLLVAVFDWLSSPALKSLHVTREVSEVLSVGTRNPVILSVRNTAHTEITLELIDETPQPGISTGELLTLTLQPGQTRSCEYRFEPHRRGRSAFAAVHLRAVSRFGLWLMLERRELKSPVRIFPDIRSVYRYELMARRNRLEELGIKIRRLRGQGNEFERLRDYRREDELRKVDWKATARNQRLISREFNVERNQNVLVIVDSGRSMLNESEGISYLDRALNASIMLSYIALGQGDNVGFMAFSSHIERALNPVRGKRAIQSILQNAFDLEAKRDTSDYSLAVEQLTHRFRKRSLVILLTHVIDEQHLDAICEPLRSIRSPHLILCVFLRDLGLTNLATKIPETDIEAYQCAAAAELLTAVERRTATLKERGILTLSSLPEQFSADVINGYLDVKARHLL
jgi:uncharacterized protein (DUF58 family)